MKASYPQPQVQEPTSLTYLPINPGNGPANGHGNAGRSLSQLPRQALRRTDLLQLVPLSNTTIYEMERRGEFPRRFQLTSRCVVWDRAEVEAWLAARRLASAASEIKSAPAPDVRLRRARPVKSWPRT